ncbi:MAG: dipeptidase [Muribaculaceae bacterium]
MNSKIKNITTALATAIMALSLGNTPTQACTSLLVGKKASADGSTIISYAADSHVLYGALVHQPAADHAPGSVRRIVDWDDGVYHGDIPEVSHTYSVIGNMNEHQLSITESTFGGRNELVDKNGIMDYGSLIYVTLQRATTAREAIKVMTDLVAEYGYCSGGESFSIADPNEIWIMEMVGKGGKEKGAVWVAIRIPDDCIAGHANQSRIHTFPLKDKQNCLYAKDVISFARQMGYYNGSDADFDFAKAYNPFDFSGLRGCDARVWSWFNRYKDGMDKYLPYIRGKKDAEIMPLYVRPDRKVSVRDVQNMMRDHFEGTPFDMTNDPGAKILYDVPYRWRPMTFKVDGTEYTNERAIATQQTGFVLVSQMRSWLPDAIGGIHWFGVDDANTAVFVPMYCCMTTVPRSYDISTADLYNFSTESAFWVNNWVANQAYARYSYMINDIRKVQNQIEDGFVARQAAIEQEALQLYKQQPEHAIDLLNEYSNNAAQDATARYLELAQYLMVKYLDGNIKKEKDGQFERSATGYPVYPQFPGYPQDYYKAIVSDPKAAENLKVIPPEE